MIDKAFDIVVEAFDGVTDRAGEPYVRHLEYVYHTVESTNPDVEIIAVLHDLVEDTDWTLSDLRDEGFNDYVVDGVDAITKRSGEHYKDYLKRVKAHDGARLVKIADITHNSDLSRLPEVRQVDMDRNRKYAKALKFLKV